MYVSLLRTYRVTFHSVYSSTQVSQWVSGENAMSETVTLYRGVTPTATVRDSPPSLPVIETVNGAPFAGAV
jgi:hypothetical protein